MLEVLGDWKSDERSPRIMKDERDQYIVIAEQLYLSAVKTDKSRIRLINIVVCFSPVTLKGLAAQNKLRVEYEQGSSFTKKSIMK